MSVTQPIVQFHEIRLGNKWEHQGQFTPAEKQIVPGSHTILYTKE